MAKGKKAGSAPIEQGQTTLRAAYRAWELGDMVLGRALAKKVIADGGMGEDEKTVKQLAEKLGLAASATALDVAQDVATRTTPPPRAFIFGAASLTVMGLLLLLARTRYA